MYIVLKIILKQDVVKYKWRNETFTYLRSLKLKLNIENILNNYISSGLFLCMLISVPCSYETQN